MCTFRRPAVLIFIFSTTGRWGRGAALFSHWLRYNFRFLVSAFAASLLLLFSFSFIFFCIFVTAETFALFLFYRLCHKTCPLLLLLCCWLSATALELIFIYISGRWFRLYICGLQYSIPWNTNKELENWQIDFFGMVKKYCIILKVYTMW